VCTSDNWQLRNIIPSGERVAQSNIYTDVIRHVRIKYDIIQHRFGLRLIIIFVLSFWVIPRRRNFMCRRFGALCPIFLLTLHMKMEGSVSKRRHIKFIWNRDCSETLAHKIRMGQCISKRRHIKLIWNIQSVPKRQHIKFRRREITQKTQYNVHNTAKV